MHRRPDSGSTLTEGSATLSELSAGAQWRRGRLSLDGAAGIAIPLGGAGDAPWPEAKLAVTYRPVGEVELQLTAARKGRLPTLRERYRSDVGNPDLDPELASYLEVATAVRPSAALTIRSAIYARETDGMIRFDGSRDQLVNVDDLSLRWIDADAELELGAVLRVGASYSYTDSYSPRFGLDSLDFLPRHRAEGWAAVASPRIRSRIRVRRLSSQIDQSTIIGARTTVDLSLFARVREGLDASLRLDNLGGIATCSAAAASPRPAAPSRSRSRPSGTREAKSFLASAPERENHSPDSAIRRSPRHWSRRGSPNHADAWAQILLAFWIK